MDPHVQVGTGRGVARGPVERGAGRDETRARQNAALERVDHSVRDGKREAEIVGVDDEPPAGRGPRQGHSHVGRRLGKRGADIKRNGPGTSEVPGRWDRENQKGYGLTSPKLSTWTVR